MKTRFLTILLNLIVIGLIFFGFSSTSVQASGMAQMSSQQQGLGVEYQLSNATNPETNRFHPASAYNYDYQQTLVVWNRNNSSTYYIEGRLLDYNGKPLGSGPTILVSGGTPVYQPAIAWDSTYAKYLLVWMRNTNLDGKTYAIWGELFNHDLTVDRSEFLIFDPATNFSCWSPRVAWNKFVSRDEYMVVWNTYDITAFPTMTPDNITQETVYANGDLVGHILVIGNSPAHLIYPHDVDLVFANNDSFGKYMWVWTQFNPSTSNDEIWAANIDANAGGYLPGLPPFRIDNTIAEKGYPRIATNGNNNFMVVWQERSPVLPHDWDIFGRQMNQIGTFFGDIHAVAAAGSTNETTPFVAAWPGIVPDYAVVYERESATGKGLWLSYNNNGANTLYYSGYTFWLDNFPAADYGYWYNSEPVGVVANSRLEFAYLGISDSPTDHTQVFSMTWTPFLVYLPFVLK